MTSHEFVQWLSDGTGRSGPEVVAVLGAAVLAAAVVAALRMTDAVNEARIHHAAAVHPALPPSHRR